MAGDSEIYYSKIAYSPVMQYASWLEGGGGGGETNTLATFFGVDSTSSTQVFCQVLSGTYTSDDTDPRNGWADYPGSDYGVFISGWGITDTDGKGLIKVGTTSNSDFADNITFTSCDSASTSANNAHGSYNATDITQENNANNGVFFSSGGLQQNSDNSHWNVTFNSGFGNSIAFVGQFWDAGTNSGFHKTPLLRITCNSVSRIFAPKGKFTHGTSGSTEQQFWSTTAGRVRCCYYPTIYDSLSGSTTDFDSQSGTSLPSSFFQYP